MKIIRILLEMIKFDNNDVGRQDWNDMIQTNKKDLIIKIVQMTPDEYLKRVNYTRFKIDYEKIKEYEHSFKLLKNNKLPIPAMWFDNKFQYDKGHNSSWHDGSHRVIALKNIGIKAIPVKIIISK